MFENIINFFKKFAKKDEKMSANSKEAAKERLHLVLMQDRANVSADFLELMKQEIIEVIKKYIDVDENAIDVRLTNKENADGTNGAPALYANIPILNIKNEARKADANVEKDETNAEKQLETEKKQEEDKKQKQESKQEDKKKEEKEKLEEKEREEIEEIVIDDSKKEKVKSQKEKPSKGESTKKENKEEDTKEELKSEK